MDSNRKVTPHFRWREFLYSETADREATLDSDPEIRRAQVLAIIALAQTLEIVRAWYDLPIRVTSGVRDAAIQELLVERGIRSSSKSDHACFSAWNRYGVGAVDWYVVGVSIARVYADLVRRLPEARYGQAILYEENGFVHLSNPADFLLNVRRRKERHLRKTSDGYEVYLCESS